MSDFLTRLSQLAEYYGVTKPSEFAKKTGFSHQTASNYLKGDRTPTLEALIKIQQAFESVSIEWLLHGKGDMLIADKLREEKMTTLNPDNAITLSDLEKEIEFLKMKLEMKDDMLKQKEETIRVNLDFIEQLKVFLKK